ncbi:MAG: 50S ribosomal protein L11 methyltransferase [Chloroflexota bacterium]|nr:50S ribosomal protein L11 methyltransferase [Chloroflexota bacterium]
MDAAAVEGLITAHLRVQPAPFVSEFRLYLAEALVPLWQATEALAGDRQAPPFWAFAWPGSLALARYLVDTPGLVSGKRVLDFGSGGGLAALAAARCGATHVLACDLDPLAQVVQRLNAELNGVTFETVCEDVVDREPAREVDVVLAGDVCYEREPSEHNTAWLRHQAHRGALVLLADPGRTHAPSAGLDLLATYDVPTLHDLESVPHKRTRVSRLRPSDGVHCGA